VKTFFVSHENVTTNF